MPGVDRYFKKRITGDIDDSKTDLVILPLIGSYGGYGSDIPTQENQSILLNVFVGLNNNNADIDAIKDSIVSIFLCKKWFVTYGPDIGTDPETGGTALTFHFSRTIERKLN